MPRSFHFEVLEHRATSTGRAPVGSCEFERVLDLDEGQQRVVPCWRKIEYWPSSARANMERLCFYAKNSNRWSGLGTHGLSSWIEAPIDALNVRRLAIHLDSRWGNGTSALSKTGNDTPTENCNHASVHFNSFPTDDWHRQCRRKYVVWAIPCWMCKCRKSAPPRSRGP